jgi:hypothetical protein
MQDTDVVRLPMCLLWNVVPTHVADAGRKGKYDRVKISPRQVVNQEAEELPESTFTSRSIWADTGVSSDGYLTASSNSIRFKRVTPGGEDYGEGGWCFYCRLKFSHAAMGIPVASREVEPGIILVHMVDVLCSFECTNSWICREIAAGEMPIPLEGSQTLLKTLYLVLHPSGPILRRARAFRLSPGFEGPLTEEEYWDGHAHTFHASPHLILAPARIQYMTKEIVTTTVFR